MEFRYRRHIRPEHLNAAGNLFGGEVMKMLDEEAAIYAMCQLDTEHIVTKVISEINFVSPGRKGDVIEIGIDVVKFGTTSITLEAIIRNKVTEQIILKIDKIVFVHIDADGNPKPHGKTAKKI